MITKAGVKGGLLRLAALAGRTARSGQRLAGLAAFGGLPDGFSADEYRELNPDVGGTALDAAIHYLRQGAAAGRPFRKVPPETPRADIVLRKLDRSGQGLEIGPAFNPIAPKRGGFAVHVLDHLSQPDLREKYRLHAVDLDAIEDVDFVWNGEPYAELTKRPRGYDWIIASHVIEHTPDLVGFLLDCDALLKEGGVLSLAIPDKRFCFDQLRPISGLGKVIDAHKVGAKIHSAGSVAEYLLDVVQRDGAAAWSQSANQAGAGRRVLANGMADARAAVAAVNPESAYLDVHAWCFVPHSFRLLVHDLYELGLIQLREVDFVPTIGCEFFVALGRAGPGAPLSRLEMLERVETETLLGLALATRPS